jgi:hypothetical protein
MAEISENINAINVGKLFTLNNKTPTSNLALLQMF